MVMLNLWSFKQESTDLYASWLKKHELKKKEKKKKKCFEFLLNDSSYQITNKKSWNYISWHVFPAGWENNTLTLTHSPFHIKLVL